MSYILLYQLASFPLQIEFIPFHCKLKLFITNYVGKMFDAIELAGKNVLNSTRVVTSEVVEHK
mgnify:CR=1 FL=1